MKLILCVLAGLLFLGASNLSYGQSWSSASSIGQLSLDWTLQDDIYTIVLKSPVAKTDSYNLVAWSLEPFNLPEPVSMVAPEGWQWRNSGGYKQFELKDSNEKYKVNGYALEPGESLTFTYKTGDSSKLVNKNGPVDGSIGFLAHVGAVNGTQCGKYLEYKAPLGNTWYDRPKVNNNETVPEPAGIIIFSTFLLPACLKFKRARV